MNDPEVLSITYDIEYFIERSKEECINKYKYDEMETECAYGNLDCIFETAFKCIGEKFTTFTSLLSSAHIYYNNIVSRSIKYSIQIDSGSDLIRLMHHHMLYDAFCLKRPVYAENYYPAINLIDTIVVGTSKLLDNHKSIRKIIIEPDNYDMIEFRIERIEDRPEEYMYTILLKNFKWKRTVM